MNVIHVSTSDIEGGAARATFRLNKAINTICTNIESSISVLNKISYDKIKEIAFDRFDILGPYMSQVPGPDGQRGFGGKCLPKDTTHYQNLFSEDNLYEDVLKYARK